LPKRKEKNSFITPFLIHLLMCLAIPGQVTEVSGNKGWVDYGDGTRREIDLTLVEAKVGDYVLVHAGFAIEKLDESDAQETLRLFREMLGGSDA